MIGPETGTDNATIEAWLGALEERHLLELTVSEVTRALRALSSCYVERREKIVTGGALDGAGKRAAFALFYGPQHFIVAREIAGRLLRSSRADGVREAEPGPRSPEPGQAVLYRDVLDLGCGTGTAGAAIALEIGDAAIIGLDLNPWAVKEANWTYSALGLRGRAKLANLRKEKLHAGRGTLIVAAYTLNELPADEDREAVRRQLFDAHGRGAGVLIIEPIARRAITWWRRWAQAFAERRGREDEWRFRMPLPSRQRALAKGAGLDVQELTARSLFVEGQL